MKKIFSALCLVAFFSACEKDINFNLKNSADVLVVDANIENGRPPVVVLTKSLDFFSTVNPTLLLNSFVRGAEVTMSNGVLTHKLKEYGTQLGGGITIYSYSIDSANLATAFVGAFSTRYTLNIKTGGKDYTATTTIPALTKKADSLWWTPAPFAEDTNNVIVMVRATDPPGLGNYIRYFTSKNSGPFLPGENSVFDDQVIDNTTYQSQVDPGIDRNNLVPFDSNYFKRGDTVSLKLCNIDKPSYTFWSTWEFAFQSIGNPFAQPNKVIGNISNGALGAFYGYSAFYKTLVIPK
ncbi:MAG: DUF4249 domain-containing protein [Ferruginibacter sp.]|nr:DUF4249 domain-containing protein [Ferruginibacter sp.]